MNSKRLTMFCALAGSWLGGYIPLLWGAGYFSLSSIMCNAAGAIVGIWIAFKLTR
jgi:hypothetical protein